MGERAFARIPNLEVGPKYFGFETKKLGGGGRGWKLDFR